MLPVAWRNWLAKFRVRRDRGILGPAIVTWPAPDQPCDPAVCPNCASSRPKPLHLRVNFTTLPGSRRDLSLLRCPDCGCLFYSLRIPPDYAEDAMLGRGRVPFYLQQGAGVSLITRPLARLRVPPGKVYLEVGCGFGFGLDYAGHAKGWHGRGIDPAGLSGLGVEMLGVSIDRRYLGAAEPQLEKTCDVIMASETIEHVPSPAAFIAVLRSMLRPGGTLILTTPDGLELRPEVGDSVLIPLLSPGLHLIFQTAESLRNLLIDGGFAHIAVERDGHSLVAFASDQPLALENDHLVLRQEYRGYLEKRAGDFTPGRSSENLLGDDLFFAFAGRAFQEAVNDGAFEQARRVRSGLDRGCQARFGSSIDGLGVRATTLPSTSLEMLADKIPINLAGILFADAILALASGQARAGLGYRFRQARAAADLLRRTLADLAMDDGMSQDIAWTSQAEELLCAAAAGEDQVLTILAELPEAPSKQYSEQRRQSVAERAFVELVNAEHLYLAEKLSQALGFEGADWADPEFDDLRSVSQRDALFCLAVLGCQQDDPQRIDQACRRFQRLRRLLGGADRPGVPAGLFQAALRGEVASLERLGRHDEAASIALDHRLIRN